MNKLSQSHDQPASGSILQSGFASPCEHNGLVHEFAGGSRLRANCTGKFGDLRKALLVVLYDVFAFHCLVGFVFARVREKVLAPIGCEYNAAEMDGSIFLSTWTSHEYGDGDWVELLSFWLNDLEGQGAWGARSTDDIVVFHAVGAVVTEVAVLLRAGGINFEMIGIIANTQQLRGRSFLRLILIDLKPGGGGGEAKATAGAQPRSRRVGLGSKGAAGTGGKGPDWAGERVVDCC